MNNKEIISVIGGNGFIGSYLVDSLLRKGYYVKIISLGILCKNNIPLKKISLVKSGTFRK